MSAMDMEDDVYEWMVGVILTVAFIMAAFVVITLLLGAINEVAYRIRRLRRRRRATKTLVEKLLESIPDVAYPDLPPPAAGAGDASDRESCVICVTPYEAGDACSVLPACKHLFHKACVAKWLRVSCTCPLCRAAVALPLPLPLPHPVVVLQLQGGELNAAESMV